MTFHVLRLHVHRVHFHMDKAIGEEEVLVVVDCVANEYCIRSERYDWLVKYRSVATALIATVSRVRSAVAYILIHQGPRSHEV